MPRSVRPSVCLSVPPWPSIGTQRLGQATRAVRTTDPSACGRRSAAIGGGISFRRTITCLLQFFAHFRSFAVAECYEDGGGTPGSRSGPRSTRTVRGAALTPSLSVDLSDADVQLLCRHRRMLRRSAGLPLHTHSARSHTPQPSIKYLLLLFFIPQVVKIPGLKN